MKWRLWLTCPAAFFFFPLDTTTIIYCALFCDEFNHVIRVCNQTDTLAISLPVNREQARQENHHAGSLMTAGWYEEPEPRTNWAYLQLLQQSVLKVSSLRRRAVIDFLSSLSLPLSPSLSKLLPLHFCPWYPSLFSPRGHLARPYGVASPR